MTDQTDVPTPRTDAFASWHSFEQLDDTLERYEIVPAHVARTLERELAAQSARIAELKREIAAVRELMNVYNLGGWTDAVGPMQRALKAERENVQLSARIDALTGALRGMVDRFISLAELEYGEGSGQQEREVVAARAALAPADAQTDREGL